jgi:hypothetical protein
MEKIIKLFTLIAVLSLAANAEAGKVYLLDLHYDKGAVSLKTVSLKDGYAPDKQETLSSYRYTVFSSGGTSLYSSGFAIPLTVFSDNADPQNPSYAGGMKILNDTSYTLLIPYFDKAKSVALYDPFGAKVLEVDVSRFSGVENESAIAYKRWAINPRKVWNASSLGVVDEKTDGGPAAVDKTAPATAWQNALPFFLLASAAVFLCYSLFKRKSRQ